MPTLTQNIWHVNPTHYIVFADQTPIGMHQLKCWHSLSWFVQLQWICLKALRLDLPIPWKPSDVFDIPTAINMSASHHSHRRKQSPISRKIARQASKIGAFQTQRITVNSQVYFFLKATETHQPMESSSVCVALYHHWVLAFGNNSWNYVHL